MELKQSSPPAVFRKVGYFQGYNLGRECLNMDATQIDSSKYTHIHFAFGLLTPKFEVKLPDESTKFQFQRFKTLKAKTISETFPC